jgi:hypothetical protein
MAKDSPIFGRPQYSWQVPWLLGFKTNGQNPGTYIDIDRGVDIDIDTEIDINISIDIDIDIDLR